MIFIFCRRICNSPILSSAAMKISNLTIVLLLFFCFNSAARGFGQEISLSAKNKPLKNIFHEISKQSGVSVLYEETLLGKMPRVSIQLERQPITKALEECLKGLPLTYIIEENIILIKEKLAAPPNVEEKMRVESDTTITGRILGADGQPLVGASVHLKGKSAGTQTDKSGNFRITVPDRNAEITISYVGYQSKTISIARLNQPVSLLPAQNETEEVVVIGYGTRRKTDLTGSLSQVKSKDINAYPSTNVVQSLNGRAPGVQVIQNSGAPGSPISIRIRGTNSIQGSSEPLYVVDGFPITGNPTMLTNADIESIDILKDASATAIYGSRGANGVVLITTKRGKKGSTQTNYQGSYSIQKPRKKLSLMNPLEYGEFYNEYAQNAGLPPYFTQQQLQEFKAMGEGVDWQDEILQSAPMQTHSLSVAGGNDKTQFTMGLGALLQDGIAKGSEYNRYTFRTSVGHQISDKFKVDFNLNMNRTNTNDKNGGTNGRGASLFSGMITIPASLSPYDENGVLTIPIMEYSFISNAMINPLNYIKHQNNQSRQNGILSNVALVYRPLSSLTFRISGGIENRDSRIDNYTSTQFVRSNGSASISTSQYTSLLNENTVTFDKTLGDHHVTVLGGFTWQNFVTTTAAASGSGFSSNIPETYDLASADLFNPPTSSFTESVLMSYLGRATYEFKQKYLLTASFRADGSSIYSEGGKWGYFPSAALAWRISRENFMDNVEFISDLKLRAGFGATGSQAIAPYSTLNLLATGKTVFDNSLYTTYAPQTRLPNNLKWETTYQTNIGFDATLFVNRLQITADYYVKNTKNLLNNVQLPSSTGYIYTIRNVGEVENKGIELGITARILNPSSPIQWDFNGNISFNKNKVKKLYDGQDIYGANLYAGYFSDFVNLVREGQPLGIFYGYKENGYDATGNITYEDINKDGVITTADKTYLGSPHPKFIYSFNNSLSWKNLELTVFFQGTQGNKLYNVSSQQSIDLTQGLNLLKEQYYDHWTPTNTNAKYPAILGVMNAKVSDRYIEDGSYLRLKNIELAYTIPTNKVNLKVLRNAQVYISGQNLVTWTKYSWYDPEISSLLSGNSINLGIDFYGYPTAKSFTAGIRIGL
jgi:TonB-linked SusC/RagA family outer membrane protein